HSLVAKASVYGTRSGPCYLPMRTSLGSTSSSSHYEQNRASTAAFSLSPQSCSSPDLQRNRTVGTGRKNQPSLQQKILIDRKATRDIYVNVNVFPVRGNGHSVPALRTKTYRKA